MSSRRFSAPTATLAIILCVVCGSAVIAAAPTLKGEASMHLYLNGQRHWCAVRKPKILEKLLASGETLPLGNNDQARIWMSGRGVGRIEEFRSDEDLEWSTTANYRLDASGAVTAVTLVTRREGLGARSHRFMVKSGAYRPKPGAGLSPAIFRQATSLADFPFQSLIRRARRIGPKAKICA